MHLSLFQLRVIVSHGGRKRLLALHYAVLFIFSGIASLFMKNIPYFGTKKKKICGLVVYV